MMMMSATTATAATPSFALAPLQAPAAEEAEAPAAVEAITLTSAGRSRACALTAVQALLFVSGDPCIALSDAHALPNAAATALFLLEEAPGAHAGDAAIYAALAHHRNPRLLLVSGPHINGFINAHLLTDAAAALFGTPDVGADAIADGGPVWMIAGQAG
jgi:hypothetical protein